MPIPLLIAGGLGLAGLIGSLWNGHRDRQEQTRNRNMMQRQTDEQRRAMSPEELRRRAEIDLEFQQRAQDASRYNTSGHTGNTWWRTDENGTRHLESSLSPQEQAKYDAQGRMVGGIEDAVTSMRDNGRSYGESMFGRFVRRSQPLMNAAKNNLDNRLWSRGISPLNENYRQSMNALNTSQTDAISDAYIDSQKAGMDLATQGLNNQLNAYGALTPQNPMNSFVPNVGGLANNPYGNAANYTSAQQGNLMNSAMNMYNLNNQAQMQNSQNRAQIFSSLAPLAMNAFGAMSGGGGLGSMMGRRR